MTAIDRARNPRRLPLYAPFEANYKFNPILPNVGIVYDFGGGFSAFASYARGFSAPRTDNLYRAPIVTVDPETTNAFDLGVRYRRSNIQAQADGWKINYQNRIVTSFNQDLGISLDRNVGRGEKLGLRRQRRLGADPGDQPLGLASYVNRRAAGKCPGRHAADWRRLRAAAIRSR